VLLLLRSGSTSDSESSVVAGSLVAAIVLGSVAAAGLSFAAWATGLMLYADGALFSFVIGVDDAWALVWHIMPARIAVYLLTVLPSETALEWGLPAQTAMQLYQALFIGFPFIAFAACLGLVEQSSRWLLVFPALSILALVTSALGYPSETIVALAAFWPALFGYRYANGHAGPVLMTLLFTAIFLFSHPGMLFSLPLLPIAAALRFNESTELGVRRKLILLGALSAVLFGLWILCFRIEMSDPGIIQSGKLMWSLSNMVTVVGLQPMILVVALCILLWGLLGWHHNRATTWSVTILYAAIVLPYELLHVEAVVPESHYNVRTALVFLLPVLGALALWRGRSVPNGAIALAMVTAISSIQLTHNLSFLGAWLNYRDSVIASISEGPARMVPLQQVLRERTYPQANSVAWSWGQPYLSLTLPNIVHKATVADPSPTSFSPFRCSQMDRVIARAGWVAADTLSVLKEYVCARRPG
jgi:hypothetical protein